jgi:Protein of unknown function (DUF2628)
MAIYSVYGRPEAIAEAAFVPEGFNWAAAVFQPFWAIYHRMWIVAAGLVVAFVLLQLLPAQADTLGSLIALLFGAFANSLRRLSLQRAGFADLGLAAGGSQEEAELRFFSGYDAPARAAAPVASRPLPSHEPLGLFD